ncbi:hypothetical protein PAPYR_9656 [Paratrimastix pyriformis]|uniref:Uncharacterized protein n=1 Tax=Paratrimastix pyriformis TaxID=342808 RepID=A0ABQ8UCQ5_9EUKA|nr:hypothetical protein PAPYR_9656 [Paratrimastix pyriformis]
MFCDLSFGVTDSGTPLHPLTSDALLALPSLAPPPVPPNVIPFGTRPSDNLDEEARLLSLTHESLGPVDVPLLSELLSESIGSNHPDAPHQHYPFWGPVIDTLPFTEPTPRVIPALIGILLRKSSDPSILCLHSIITRPAAIPSGDEDSTDPPRPSRRPTIQLGDPLQVDLDEDILEVQIRPAPGGRPAGSGEERRDPPWRPNSPRPHPILPSRRMYTSPTAALVRTLVAMILVQWTYDPGTSLPRDLRVAHRLCCGSRPQACVWSRTLHEFAWVEADGRVTVWNPATCVLPDGTPGPQPAPGPEMDAALESGRPPFIRLAPPPRPSGLQPFAVPQQPPPVRCLAYGPGARTLLLACCNAIAQCDLREAPFNDGGKHHCYVRQDEMDYTNKKKKSTRTPGTPQPHGSAGGAQKYPAVDEKSCHVIPLHHPDFHQLAAQDPAHWQEVLSLPPLSLFAKPHRPPPAESGLPSTPPALPPASLATLQAPQNAQIACPCVRNQFLSSRLHLTYRAPPFRHTAIALTPAVLPPVYASASVVAPGGTGVIGATTRAVVPDGAAAQPNAPTPPLAAADTKVPIEPATPNSASPTASPSPSVTTATGAPPMTVVEQHWPGIGAMTCAPGGPARGGAWWVALATQHEVLVFDTRCWGVPVARWDNQAHHDPPRHLVFMAPPAAPAATSTSTPPLWHLLAHSLAPAQPAVLFPFRPAAPPCRPPFPAMLSTTTVTSRPDLTQYRPALTTLPPRALAPPDRPPRTVTLPGYTPGGDSLTVPNPDPMATQPRLYQWIRTHRLKPRPHRPHYIRAAPVPILRVDPHALRGFGCCPLPTIPPAATNSATNLPACPRASGRSALPPTWCSTGAPQQHHRLHPPPTRPHPDWVRPRHPPRLR